MGDDTVNPRTPPRRRRRRQFKPSEEAVADINMSTVQEAHTVDAGVPIVVERDAPVQLSAEKPRRPRRRRPFTSSSSSPPPPPPPAEPVHDTPLEVHDVSHEDDAWDFGGDAADHAHATAQQAATVHHDTAVAGVGQRASRDGQEDQHHGQEAIADPAGNERNPAHTQPSQEHQHQHQHQHAPRQRPSSTDEDRSHLQTGDYKGGDDGVGVGGRHGCAAPNRGSTVPTTDDAPLPQAREESVGEASERNGNKRSSSKRSPRRFFSALRGSRKKKDGNKQAAEGPGSCHEAGPQPTQQRSGSASRDKVHEQHGGDSSKNANMEVVERIRKQHERQLLDEQQNGAIKYDATDIVMSARIPLSIRRCIQYIASPRALKEEGLFRVSGNKTRIDELQTLFNAGKDPSLDSIMDPSTVCGLLKLNLREHELPIDRKSAQRMLRAIEGATTHEKQLRRVRKVLSSLTPLRFETFHALLLLFRKVVGWEGNRMKVSNLSTSVGPTTFPAMAAQNCSKVLGFLLRHLEACFQDIAPSSQQSGACIADTTTAASTPYSAATVSASSMQRTSTSPSDVQGEAKHEEERLRQLVLQDTQARAKAPMLRF